MYYAKICTHFTFLEFIMDFLESIPILNSTTFLSMHFLVLAMTTDPAARDVEVQWRDDLLQMFFQDISHEGIQIISLGNPARDYCDGWEGIACEGEIVRKISFNYVYYGNFNPHSLPHTTSLIRIQWCKQTFTLSIRSLPRKLVVIYLNDNRIRGSVDLTSLPRELKAAFFDGNKLEGPIELTRLPSTLVYLHLFSNKIHQNTVWYDNLPKDIRTIKLLSRQERRFPRIREVRSLNGIEHTNPWIFEGIKADNIH